uniref:Uncharacterized protein n=1 Tax=Glossina austeni TaxID=7395 RepID=A0A1A9VTJ1_GLOAU
MQTLIMKIQLYKLYVAFKTQSMREIVCEVFHEELQRKVYDVDGAGKRVRDTANNQGCRTVYVETKSILCFMLIESTVVFLKSQQGKHIARGTICASYRNTVIVFNCASSQQYGLTPMAI